jgi:serine/threonine-protein kinase
MATNTETQSPPGQAPNAEQPKRLGKYVIQKRLGAGGMGTVFLALDSELHRTVALKVLPKERAANATLVKRFKSEGQAAARLEHDNIVKVFEAGEIDGHLYLALEYVDGIDVQDLVQKRGVVPVRRSIEIIRQVASALQHACERNIVHRDIKPSNLMIRKDSLVKLADMGLARAIDETAETSITRDGMTVGTVDYMAPEQARDSKLADIRSDIYSLGCTWYYMLTGSPPFPEGSVTGKLQAHATQPLPDPRQKNERVPEALAAVIQRMTAKRPIDRYQSPAELIEELKQAHLSRPNLGEDLLAGLSTPQAATAEGGTVARGGAGGVGDEPLPQKMKIKPAAAKQRAVKNVAREEAEPAEAEPLPQKMKIKKRRDGTDGQGGRSVAQGASGRSAGSGSSAPRQQRELPPRSENPEALGVSQRRLDPELLKFGFFGLLGVVILSSVVWFVVQMTGWGEGDTGGGGINPYQPRIDAAATQSNPVPSVVTPVGPPTTAQPDVDATPTATIAVPSRPDYPPFPGVEDASTNPAAGDVPEWVYEERSAGYAGLKQFTVSPAGGTGSFESLQAALAEVPPTGGLIEFIGRGPYAVPPLDVKDRARIVLRGAAGSTPVLIMTGGDGEKSTGITMHGGRLELAGLHLVAGGPHIGPEAALLAADSATLIVRDCSLTLADPVPQPVAAVSLSGSRPTASRCVLENVVVRGNNLSAAVLSGGGQQLVAGNFLFASGDAPTIVMVRPAAPPARQSGEPQPARVELLGGVVLSRQRVLELAHAPGLEAPSVKLRARRTAFVSTDGTGRWLQLERWPEGPVNDLEHPRAKGVEWRADEVWWFGWPQLVRMTDPAGTELATATNESEWRQFWRDGVDSRAFAGAIQGLSEIDLSRADAALVESSLQAALATAGEPEGQVGFDLRDFPPLPESMLDRARAVAGRPRMPPGFGEKRPGSTKEFDLSKGQGLMLGAFVESSECRDGTCIILKGSGLSQIKPFRIVNKSIRLEFDSAAGKLTVEPVQSTAGPRAEALIQVAGGRLELVGGHLRIPASDSRTYPLRILQVVDGSFAVQNCILQGQIGPGAQDVACVDWRQTAVAESTQYGLVSNSLLVGNTMALSADLSERLLELRNSIVASVRDGISLRATPRDGHVLVSECTLSVPRAFFRAETGEPRTARLRVFIDNTVFGPSTVAGKEGPCILTHAAGAEADGRIDWWEERTAYDRRITRFREIPGEPAEGSQDFSNVWVKGWGADHVLDALIGPTAVVLAGALPAPEKSRPEDYALAATCGAARARIGGTAVGVQVARIGPQGLRAAAPGTAPATQPTRTAPKSTDPDF